MCYSYCPDTFIITSGRQCSELLTVSLGVQMTVVSGAAPLSGQPAPWRRGSKEDELAAEDAPARGPGRAPGGQGLVPAGPGGGPTGVRPLPVLRHSARSRLVLTHLLAASL